MRYLDRPLRTILIALAISSLVPLTFVFSVLGAIPAIKGAYVFLGIILAAGICRGEPVADTIPEVPQPLDRWAVKLVLALTLGAYLWTYARGERLWAVVVVLAVGYTVVAIQIHRVGLTKSLIPQILLLSLVGPITKHLSTGFYYGETDILGHVRAAELLYHTGQSGAIGLAYESYDLYPLLHILTGAVASFTGFPAYDSLMAVGTLVYLVAIIAVFYLCQELFTTGKAVAITLLFSIMSITQFHTTYFFPQAFATALIFYLFYVTVRRSSSPSRYHPALSLLTVLVVGGLVFAHHVTIIIFAGITGVLYAPSVARWGEFGRRLGTNEKTPRFVPMLFALTAGVTYLVVSSTNIISYFVQFVGNQATNPFVTGTGGARAVIGLGIEIPFHTPSTAFVSLFSVDGIYYIGFTTLFAIGLTVTVARYGQYANRVGFLLLGIIGAPLVLKTPLLTTVSRLSLPLSLFFALIAGIGLWELNTNRRNQNGEATRLAIRPMALSLLIVVVCITGPLVAGDDLYRLHSGPNLWETYSTPEQQVEFSEQELKEIEAMTKFVDTHSSEATMLWVTREASDRFGGEERLEPTSITEEGIRVAAPFVYREKWTRHQVGFSADFLGTAVFSDWWLYREINATNKVYSTGQVGILSEEQLYLPANRTVG